MGLTNLQILDFTQKLKVPYFRGVYSLDLLPKDKRKCESFIVNLAKSSLPGTHWVLVYRSNSEKNYFDSFGAITPEIIQRYLKSKNEFEHNIKCIQRSTEQIQQFNTDVCGHMCIFVLVYLYKYPKHSFNKILKMFTNKTYKDFENKLKNWQENIM